MIDNYFVDTNILVYFRDASEPDKQKIAAGWLQSLWENQTGRISWQVLNEYYVVVTQKLKPGLSPDAARRDVKSLMTWDPVGFDRSVIENAWMLQKLPGFSWWDTLILSAALQAGCTTLLSEDLQHGQYIQGLTVLNPFC